MTPPRSAFGTSPRGPRASRPGTDGSAGAAWLAPAFQGPLDGPGGAL
jgi:hypothetical protein